MKRFILFAIVLLAGLISSAQNAKAIVGKWAFGEVYEKEKIDAESLRMTDMLFKDFTLNFRADGTMTLNIRKKDENGSFEIDKSDDKKLIITSASGKISTMTILKLDNKQLILTMGDSGAMVMNKLSDTPDAIIVKAALPKVAATPGQIIAKWDVVDMEREKNSELFKELIKGSYIEFFKDNTYHTKILSFEENGVWNLAQDNTVIEVETAEDKGFWNIIQISDTSLTMQRGSEGKKYFFKKAAK